MLAPNGYSLPIVGQKTAKKQLNILPYFGKVLLYSRSFSSFFVRGLYIIPSLSENNWFENQQVTGIMKNSCKYIWSISGI